MEDLISPSFPPGLPGGKPPFFFSFSPPLFFFFFLFLSYQRGAPLTLSGFFLLSPPPWCLKQQGTERRRLASPLFLPFLFSLFLSLPLVLDFFPSSFSTAQNITPDDTFLPPFPLLLTRTPRCVPDASPPAFFPLRGRQQSKGRGGVGSIFFSFSFSPSPFPHVFDESHYALAPSPL